MVGGYNLRRGWGYDLRMTCAEVEYTWDIDRCGRMRMRTRIRWERRHKR